VDKLEIAELCGIILGDGHLHNSANRIVITGSLDDAEYHKQVVSRLFTENFDVKPIYFEQRQKNAHYLQIESKKCIDYFLGLGLERGSKEDIQAPCFINNDRLRMHFLRGLFDTDGWIKFSSQKTKSYYYPRIRLTAKESRLAYQIGDMLKLLGFHFSVWKDQRTENTILTYEISGKDNALRWFEVIQPHNPKHLKRYSAWLADGQVLPKK
jgi:intein/homing endonuclease